MGNFLDTPITDKETEIGADDKLSYGLSAMQGWRAQMEDDHVQLLALPGLPDISLFGVYDGHGGDMVAHYVAKNFPQKLMDTKQLPPGVSEADVPTQSKLAFEKALMAIDAEMRALPEVESGQDQSGSTSVMTLVSKQHIVCANTGDSRAVLCRGGKEVPLSHDHKPYNPIEKERIEAAGSHVKFNRVNGDLAVSRALGDFVYKRCETVEDAEQAVTAFPDVLVEGRTAADEFIVLACDGIWDVMSSQEVCDKVREMLLDGRPPPPPPDPTAEPEEPSTPGPGGAPPPPRPWDLGAVAECLIDHCLRLGSRDNMSVIVVLLDPKFTPKPEAVGAAGIGHATAGEAASGGSGST
mmetsp:Transcript_1364/g.3859  ORF Transcript_1364/g.3859 Transcript_1364/m.3859 type:complete len:353 (+) Transcript_1364:147-1205(+)